MNRALTAPFRVAGAGLRRAGAFFSATGAATVHNLALLPGYLAGLLYLINTRFEDLAREGFAGNSAAYACLRLLSTSVAEPPLLAYTTDRAGKRTPLPVDHPLVQLIARPNELMTEYEYWELTALHLAICGRSFWYKERDHRGQMIAQWPLRPDRIGPVYATSDQAGQHVIGGWSYHIPGTAQYIELRREDVVAYNFPDPAGESGGIVEGLGPLMVLAAEISVDNEATRFVGNLLANRAQPGVVITKATQLADEAEATLIKAAFMRDFGGMRRGEPAVIDGGCDIKEIGFSLSDLEFPDLRDVSESRIAAAIGVPAILVGLRVGLRSGIKATIADQREFFAETTLACYWRRFQDTYTVAVASEFSAPGAPITCGFDLTKVRALVSQTTVTVTRVAAGFANGVLTVNEYREALGYPPRDDGDVYMYGIAPGRGVQTPQPAAATEPLDGVGEEDIEEVV